MMTSSLRPSLAVLALAPLAAAQSYTFSLDSKSSTTDLGASMRLELPGTAIGNFDAATNATGTITCTNIFGSCNNSSFTMNSALVSDNDFAGAPSGTFVASIDTVAGVALISDLAVAALGKSPGVGDLTLEIEYQTFRTLQPTSVFPGGFTVPIPLGQLTVDNLLLQQTGPAVPGVLVSTPVNGVFDFNAIVPANLSFDIDVLGNSSSIGPVPFPLPIVGTLDLTGAQPLFTLYVSQTGSQTIPDPAPGQTIDDYALDIPTVLPAGSIAHLLLDATIGQLVFDSAVDLVWSASGAPKCESSSYCSATPNTYSGGAQVMSIGSNSITFGTFELMAHGVPPQHPGRFCMGSAQAFTPFGDGHLCVGGTFRRFPVVFADLGGTAIYDVDFLTPGQPGSLIAPGSTWNFQLVFRDPLGGPLTFNTSDAIAVTFCP